MESGVVDLPFLSESLSLSSRDNQLNEKAFQRAIAVNALQNGQTNLFHTVDFHVSQDLSLNQIIQEKNSRERVVKMQEAINTPILKAELVMH